MTANLKPTLLPLPLRIGVIGLGRAFTLMLPTLQADPRVRLVAATDPLDPARRQFEIDFAVRADSSSEALCARSDVDVVYIASPHQFHTEHAVLAAAHGKHVWVEKPMALGLGDCTRMIEATQVAGVQLMVGHSHSFDGPVLRTRQLIDSGDYGAVKMIHAFNYTDFLYRPRRPQELDTAAGGGVIYSQAAHQIDIVRLLGGGQVKSVRAFTGAWDSGRPTEGAYSALLGFANGAFASATYSGYGHFDSDELLGNIGEMGQTKTVGDYGMARKRLRSFLTAQDEIAAKAARNYGGQNWQTTARSATQAAHQHFGHMIVSCEKADLRPDATGVTVYGDHEKRFDALPLPTIPRVEVIDELVNAVGLGQQPLHSGSWARASLAVCLAIQESAQKGLEVVPAFQTAYQAGTQRATA